MITIEVTLDEEGHGVLLLNGVDLSKAVSKITIEATAGANTQVALYFNHVTLTGQVKAEPSNVVAISRMVTNCAPEVGSKETVYGSQDPPHTNTPS